MTKPKRQPFEIKDCALAAIGTGKTAENLKELRDIISEIDSESIYYHFWGGLLRPRFDDPEFNNDFAAWARHSLHDKVLAEKLGMINPIDFPNLEDLRNEIIEIIEERLDETEHIPWSNPDDRFHFIISQIVVFDTRKVIKKAKELTTAIPTMTPSSVYYHFIDARRRTFGNIDDFRTWLYGFGNKYEDLCDLLGTVDPFFMSLTDLRRQLTELVIEYYMERLT
jgi:hypothetical protein